MGDVRTLTWTLESDDKEEKNYALFVSDSSSGKKVQLSGWMDSPQDVIEGVATALDMGAPEPPD